MNLRFTISWWWMNIDRTISQHAIVNGRLHKNVRRAFSWDEVARIERDAQKGVFA